METEPRIERHHIGPQGSFVARSHLRICDQPLPEDYRGRLAEVAACAQPQPCAENHTGRSASYPGVIPLCNTIKYSDRGKGEVARIGQHRSHQNYVCLRGNIRAMISLTFVGCRLT